MLCVIGEVSLVAAARFHYTSDMLVSIVLVVLLFDSIHIGQLAADWSEGFSWQDSSFIPESSFQGLFQCKDNNTEKVVPSQGYMVNLRRVVDYHAWRNAQKPDSSQAAE